MPKHPAEAVDTILLIEDNADDEALTIRALRQSGVRAHLTVCRDGEEAMRFLETLETSRGPMPRLILMDLKLPKVNGMELLGRIRNWPRLRQVAVVMLTSSDEPSDQRRCAELGANSFVHKPVDYEEYLVEIARIARIWLPSHTAVAVEAPAVCLA